VWCWVQVILLQSYWRRWLASVYVAGVRRDKLQREEWERQEVARRQQERLDRAKREFERRMNPKTKTDFDLLFHALEGTHGNTGLIYRHAVGRQ